MRGVERGLQHHTVGEHNLPTNYLEMVFAVHTLNSTQVLKFFHFLQKSEENPEK